MNEKLITKAKILHKVFSTILIISLASLSEILEAQPMSGDWTCSTEFGNFTFTVNFEGTRINKLIFEAVNWTCGNVSGSWTTTVEWPEPNGWSISNDHFDINRVVSGEGWIVGGTFNQSGNEASGTWSYENGWGTVCSGSWGPIVVTSINEGSSEIPKNFELSQNYPNPFNPRTAISYTIPYQVKGERFEVKNLTLRVYDVLGREVAVLVNENQKPGDYEVDFDGSKLTNGIYFYRLNAGDYVDVKKMILLK